MRSSALVLAIVLLAGCTSTQVIDSNWHDPTTTETVRDVAAGQRVNILLRNGRSFESRDVRLFEDTLWVALPSGGVRPASSHIVALEGVGHVELLPLDRIESIRVRAARKRWDFRSIVWGALAGVAVGYVVDEAADTTERTNDCFIISPCDKHVDRASGAIWVGGLVGAAVGGVIGGTRFVVYRFRPDTSKQVSVVIRAGRAGRRLGVDLD